MKTKINALLLVLISTFTTVYGQELDAYQELLNQSNKMIAVILVLVIILLGIAVFLLFIEKRIRKLENQNKKIK